MYLKINFSGTKSSETIIETAKQMNIFIVNYQWLVEVYFGNMRPLTEPQNPKYSPLNPTQPDFETNVSAYNLENISDLCKKLLCKFKRYFYFF